MQPLEKSLRNKLERTVKEAREIAEEAARVALEQLGVEESKAYPHLSDDDRKLRRRLRAHGRQLGNGRNAKGEQSIDRLIEEVAYEHWHRMLFARFLAENDLLMYMESTKDTKSTNENHKDISSISCGSWTDAVPVTLEECEDLAADEGAANGWELAARFAARMLPQIFRLESPVFQLELPPEHQQKLERLVTDLSFEVFTASDSLGWVYQFWQSKKKDEVNASEVKIGARELHAVTQLFTEPYMVSFLLDNALGAWWATRRLSDNDLKNASGEEELRRKAAIPGVPLEYLRFVQVEDEEGNKRWVPAAGSFDGWPEQLRDLKTLDPCCGSGHFLVAAFLMLVPMRMELEGISAKEAVDAVLRENIHGLELDQRCVELAVFALAFTAWKYPDGGDYRVLPELNMACSGLSISSNKEEWLALARDNTNLRLALEELYKIFKDAPVLGSLINPETSLSKDSLFELNWDEVGSLLTKALAGQKDDEKAEMGVIAKGITKTTNIFNKKFCWVITNVPYLLRRKQHNDLKNYVDRCYPEARHDLATSFLERCFEYCNLNDGVVQAVMPQNWFFLVQYKNLRQKFVTTRCFDFIARLGPKAFDSIGGEVVNTCLITFKAKAADSSHDFSDIDVSSLESSTLKSELLRLNIVKVVRQKSLLQNVDTIISSDGHSSSKLLSDNVKSFHGLSTTDAQRFTSYFWEMDSIDEAWEFQIGTIKSSSHYGGRNFILRWENGAGALNSLKGKAPIVITGLEAWGKDAVSVSQMGQLAATIYNGNIFLDGTAILLPHNENELKTIFTYCESVEYAQNIRKIDKSIKITYSTLAKVPFDIDHWSKVAQEKYPKGLPKPYSDDPTQWIFNGHPCGSVVWDENKKWTIHGPLRTDTTVLQIAVARLLGYRWPAELDTNMELANEQREWVSRCKALLHTTDDDGIVCIPPMRGEASASDRLLNLLAASYGDVWGSDALAELLKSVQHAGKTLETWMREKFFNQHCKLFRHRPFIWHIWDGLRDGFAALVNYHKLDAKLLETLIYTYLGDWVSRQKQDIDSGVDGAQERLAAAEALKKKLELILEGEKPYDIFVRWKPIEKQPIGWNPDLNDGVRINIRPFMTVGDVKRKGAGVLRDKPNIKWGKDRGKDVESAPWYHLFKGDRINDHHISLVEKRKSKKVEIT